MFQAETKYELTAEKLHITALADTCNVTFYASLKSDFWKSIGHVLVFIFLNTPIHRCSLFLLVNLIPKVWFLKEDFFSLYGNSNRPRQICVLCIFFPSFYGTMIHVFIYNRSTFIPNYASRNLLYWPLRNEKLWICANCHNCTATVNLTTNN